jgi:hypothetical protein
VSEVTTGVDLYWIPLGAGTRVVQFSGRCYEAVVAGVQRRERSALFHAALLAHTAHGSYSIEMTPVPREGSPVERGVVAEGAVGMKWLGGLRVFRYEVRCWQDGVIPDLGYAVASPIRLTDDDATVEQVIQRLPGVPTFTWGRDEAGAGDMWNSNSVVAWLLAGSGLERAAGSPPRGGRAPGWDAGRIVAARVASST